MKSYSYALLCAIWNLKLKQLLLKQIYKCLIIYSQSDICFLLYTQNYSYFKNNTYITNISHQN